MSKGASDFKKIPYVGEATEADLLALGYEGIASLKGADPSRCLNAQRRSDVAAIGASSTFTEASYYANTPCPRQSQAEMVALEGLNLRI